MVVEKDAQILESPACRALSRSAHLVISRIEVELAHRGGNDNRRLPVTTDQFVEYGMHRSSVALSVCGTPVLRRIRTPRQLCPRARPCA